MTESAGDGQHVHGQTSISTGDLMVDDDMKPVVRKHYRQSPVCFPKSKTDGEWPVVFDALVPGCKPPYKVNVTCGRCRKIIGQCTVMKFGKK